MASPFFSDFGLMWYLEELKKKEFMKFKELLKQETSHLGLKQIPWAEVKRASREELASLLLKHYEEQQAWDVTFRVFQRIDRGDLCERATRESTGAWGCGGTWLLTARLASGLADTTKAIHFGVGMTLEVISGSREGEIQQCLAKESIATIHKHFYENITQEKSKYLELLFTSKKPGKPSHTVLLKGNQGIGKTTFLTKLMLAWSKGLIYQDRFSYVFYLCCQELKQLPATSLAELITSAWPDTSAPVSEILAHPEKLLFVVDSFEELGCNLREPECELCRDWVEARPPRLLLSSLLRRKMVPECSLLVTVDLKAGQGLEDRLEDPDIRMLRGFHDSDIKLCICSVFQDVHRATEAFSIIQSNEQFLALCRLPVLCWLVCTALKHETDRGKGAARTCQRTTALYSSFLFNLFTPRTADSPGWQGQAQLHGLCSLAVQGMWTDCFMFGDKDLGRNGIGGSDVPALLELRILLRCQGSEPSYKLLHSSVQEFCTALFYLLKSPGHHPHPAMGGTQDLLLIFLEKSRAPWVFLGCFLFGLLHERERQRLAAFFGFQLCSEVKQQLYQCLQCLGKARNRHGKIIYLALFYSLFEMQEEAFVSQAMGLMQELTFSILNKTDLEVSAYCLKHCSNLRKLGFSVQGVFKEEEKGHSSVGLPVGGPDLRTAEAWMPPWTPPARCPCTCPSQGDRQTRLQSWRGPVCSVLTNKELLQTLQVKDSTLSESAVTTLFNQLKQPNCLLQNLLINSVTVHCESWLLFEVFTHNPNLKHLNLTSTSLCRNDVKFLCSMLSHPACNVVELVLINCKLTADDCKAFASILMDSRKLKQLNLASNYLKKGVRTLCKALCHPDCALQLLVRRKDTPVLHIAWVSGEIYTESTLALCYLSDWCWDYLAEVLLTSKSLVHLDLSTNTLRDEGLKVLCEALRYPACRLQALCLMQCSITAGGCGDLAEVLTSNGNLRSLQLGGNHVGDAGVKLLCGALAQPSCHLENLGVASPLEGAPRAPLRVSGFSGGTEQQDAQAPETFFPPLRDSS
ncbi:NACHT, LRR and PYD domains-containing protein 4 [Erethizon dorsatum]